LDLYGEEATLRIRMLSYPKGAALWEYSIKNESWSELNVSSEFVREYDLINNDCVNQKCYQEFQFDQIDFSRLKFND
jgi:spore cortex formation protein SpoVR/YcgB (stage V sporulation)